MSTTLKLISVQHELGMAIGLDLRLLSMLNQFTNVCIRRLGLAGVQYHLNYHPIDDVLDSDIHQNIQLAHILSLPENLEIQDRNSVTQVFGRLCQEKLAYIDDYIEAEEKYIYNFNLNNLGLVTLIRYHKALDKNILELLRPIFQRLSISCQASIEHEQLLIAVEGRKKAEDTIIHQLYHDELTQLPNRRMLMKRLSFEIEASRQSNLQGALLFIDLDRFKAVNDTLGHAVGDLLLKKVAEILLTVVRVGDDVVRLSGDEFVIIITKIRGGKTEGHKVVNIVLDKIRNVFSKPVLAGEHLLHITPSIGVEFYKGSDVDADRLLRNADTAMYLAKAKGYGSSAFYDKKMSRELEQRLDIEKELQIAIKTLTDFSLVFQPQFNELGICIGAEALLRWQSTKGKMIPPGLFIPVAEETGLMLELGDWVLRKVCEYLKDMENRSVPKHFNRMSFNVSPIQFNQSNFVEKVSQLVAESNINPGMLSIELTETMLVTNIEDMVKKITRLRNMGIRVSIDDFGTGYSSLAYLNQFPIELLKIDQAFVRNLHENKSNLAIVETIMALGRSLNLSIIAEGVESIAELNCLKMLGCKYFQGYYFSRPVPYQEFLKIMRQKIV